ncbi:MAG: hypothetical protein RLP44_22445 [Aggregatilineales bacterium]
MRRIIFVLIAILSLTVTIAQEETPEPTATNIPADELIVEDVRTTAGRNAFDQVELMAVGNLVNNTEEAYTNISLFADVLNADGEIIGEGFGYLVNTCGNGLNPDFAVEPDSAQGFSIALDIFEADADIEDVSITIQSTATDPTPSDLPAEFTGITRASTQEVVSVEWLDEEGNLLRYGVGCDEDVFTEHDWYQYNALRGDSAPTVNPNTELVTQALRDQLGIADPNAFDHSFLTFSPTARRLLHQTPINVMISAEPDGSFRRLIYEDLSRFTLQGFLWMPEGRFLAYYFGATGDPVRYYTASVEGQRISGSIDNTLPSLIVPGPTPDGARVVMATTIDGVTGYYLASTIGVNTELLFEAEPPGNNFPAPIYVPIEGGGAQIYLFRQVDDVPRLQCFDTVSSQLNDITALPLQLDDGSRAWAALTVNGSKIALAANGVNGGLWIIDLQSFGGCTPQLAG